MIRRPPRSTLFPTRRSSDLDASHHRFEWNLIARHRFRGMLRSEEHTSELQSRLHLVCRLLLEKKRTEPILGNSHGLRPSDWILGGFGLRHLPEEWCLDCIFINETGTTNIHFFPPTASLHI